MQITKVINREAISKTPNKIFHWTLIIIRDN